MSISIEEDDQSFDEHGSQRQRKGQGGSSRFPQFTYGTASCTRLDAGLGADKTYSVVSSHAQQGASGSLGGSRRPLRVEMNEPPHGQQPPTHHEVSYIIIPMIEIRARCENLRHSYDRPALGKLANPGTISPE